MQINAIIGASASGKSALALDLARRFELDIFSIDSLSVYKYVDIASAKPTKQELSEIRHYGIDELEPLQKCNAMVFYNLAQKVAHDKLLIVGGSGFYLKSIIDGLSEIPNIVPHLESKIAHIAQKKAESYKLLCQIDAQYAQKINPNDTYRIQKALEIFLVSNTKPSEFFSTNKRKKLPFDIRIYEIIMPREELKNRIIKRTEAMFVNGLVNEVAMLKTHYANSQILKAIGVKEIVRYLNGEITLDNAKELIIKNTNALTKRQRTFNRTQFSNVVRGNSEEIRILLSKSYESTLNKSSPLQ